MADLNLIEASKRTPNGVVTPFVDAIDPRSVLPVHLQQTPFNIDIWQRVKGDPIRNPALFRATLDEDVQSREIVRQVMAAALQREVEVLLHNQARVFSHVLGRALSEIRHFLDNPIVSIPSLNAQRRLPGSQSAISLPSDSDEERGADSVEGTDTDVTKPGFMATIVGWLLTPKYFLFLLVAFLGVATGWSQLELQHLRKATEAYEKSAKASDDLSKKMEATVADSEKQRVEYEARIQSLRDELATAQSNQNQASNDLQVLKNTIDAKDLRITELQKERDQLLGTIAKDEKDTTIANLQAEKDRLTSQISKLMADETVNLSEIERLKKDSESFQLLQTHISQERQAHNQQVSGLQSQIGLLLVKEAMLIDAQACISTVEQQIKRWSYDHETVKKAVEMYRTQEQTRKSMLANPRGA